MGVRFWSCRLVGAALLWLVPGALAFQMAEPPGEEPASEPASTQPAESEPTTRAVGVNDPQHSPRATLREFLLAVNEARTKPERIKDAVGCLNLAGVDLSQQNRGPQIAERLALAIDEVFRRKGLSTDTLPDDPTGPPFVLFEQDGNKIELSLQEDGRWRFTTDTIGSLDKLEQAYREAVATQPVEPPKETGVPPEYRTPRATFDTFLKATAAADFARAAMCLDLSALPAAGRAESGVAAARKLKDVLALLKPVVLQDIPDAPLAPTFVYYVDESGRVELTPMDAGDRKGAWLFTAATVDKLDLLQKALRARSSPTAAASASFWSDPDGWVRERLPDEYKRSWGTLEIWQWVALLVFAVVGDLFRRAIGVMLRVVALPLLRTRESSIVPVIVARRMRPTAWVATLLLWWGGVQVLDIPIGTLPYFVVPLRIALVVAIIWAILSLIDLVINNVAQRIQERSRLIDNVIAPLIQQVLKVVVVIIGAIWFLQAVGFHVDALIAGLGVGGLAFGLAAQDTLKSFFGSVNVAIDRPFQVGDWVKIGAAEGKVESVGLRSSRLRTANNSEITIPNSEIVNAVIDNFGRRRYRRVHAVLGFEYSTPPELLESFCEGLRELIRENPHTNKSDFVVYVNNLSASTIDVLLNCYLDVSDYNLELEQRHRLLLDTMRLAARLGVKFAFPSQTVHLVRDDDNGELPPDAPTTESRLRGLEAARAVLARK